MNIPPNFISTVKKSYQSVRVANFHPTGVLATRVLVLTMLVPILLVVVEYIMVFIQGYVSDDIVGFLALWIDKDGNGIPDKLEEQPKLPPLQNMPERSDKNEKRI